MMNIYFDEDKIKLFAFIQEKLNLLEPNSSDEKIDEIINLIPPDFFDNQDQLKLICEIFAIYARNRFITKKMNSIRLFERIMKPMKKHLSNESIFFWNIFGGLFYFKLWMFNEGLITIETIVQEIRKNKSNKMIEYFLPEIIEYEPEIFDKEFKYNLTIPLSQEYLNKFKEIRKKHFKWINESGDYIDPIYNEIETNPLRLAIKMDDFNSFQKIISINNISLNMKISESSFENFLLFSNEMTLLEYALVYNAVTISKYLILNNANMTKGAIYCSISSKNYELVHIVENMNEKDFEDLSLLNSISDWNNEVTEYVLNKYEKYDFLRLENIDIENSKLFFDIIQKAFHYLDFIFIESTLIPFFKKNPQFFEKNINEILSLSFADMSCFFAKEFLKNPNIDINYYSKLYKCSILGNAIKEKNLKGAKLILNNPNLNINAPAMNCYPIIIYACSTYATTPFLKLICNHPNINIRFKNSIICPDALSISIANGNHYSAKFLIDNFPDIGYLSYDLLFFIVLKKHYLFTLKIILEEYLNKNKNKKCDQITKLIKNNFLFSNEYRDELLDDFEKIYNEVTKAAISQN